jgi:YbgC/YbaW family acyl-CoA thioester hydrolase
MRVFHRDLTVRSYELDVFGHVNHAVYLNYLELARFDALEEGGFPPQMLEENGWAIHVVRVEVDYLKPTFQGQILRVQTQVERFRNTSMTIAQEIRRLVDGPNADPALRSRVTIVWIGQDGRPVRIPAQARQSLGGDLPGEAETRAGKLDG